MEGDLINPIKISIIIPVYNCAPYLIKGFKHLEQLYKSNTKFEIIYVNDGSTDNSLDILEQIKSNNRFVKIINQVNQGSSGARNSAIKIAKGKYIQFLDADDYIDIEKVLPLLEKAILLNIDVFGYRIDFVDEHSQKLGEMPKFLVDYDKVISGNYALVSGYQPSSICLFLFKTSFLIDNNLLITPKITHMDVEFMLRVMLSATKVFFVDLIAYHYVQRTGSITKPTTKIKLEKYLFDEVVVANLMKSNLRSNMSKELIISIKKNYNSVVWNLFMRFHMNPNEVSYAFKTKCINSLKENNLYPIKGDLKTPFQKITRPFFNSEWLLRKLIK